MSITVDTSEIMKAIADSWERSIIDGDTRGPDLSPVERAPVENWLDNLNRKLADREQTGTEKSGVLARAIRENKDQLEDLIRSRVDTKICGTRCTVTDQNTGNPVDLSKVTSVHATFYDNDWYREGGGEVTGQAPCRIVDAKRGQVEFVSPEGTEGSLIKLTVRFGDGRTVVVG